MKILGVIPARYESSRFPGKPLIDLKGKTMIQRVYEGASSATTIHQVVVATDDQRIYDHVKSFGGEVMMTSNSHTTGTDRCAEVAEHYACDVVINIQGDEPLVNSVQLDTLSKAFEDPSVLIATLGIKAAKEDLENANRIKLVTDVNGNALYFSRSAIPNSSNASEIIKDQFPYLRHIGLYAYRKEVLKELTRLERTSLEQIESLEQLRWLYYGFKIRIVPTTIETPNIDVPEDVEKVLAFL